MLASGGEHGGLCWVTEGKAKCIGIDAGRWIDLMKKKLRQFSSCCFYFLKLEEWSLSKSEKWGGDV